MFYADKEEFHPILTLAINGGKSSMFTSALNLFISYIGPGPSLIVRFDTYSVGHIDTNFVHCQMTLT